MESGQMLGIHIVNMSIKLTPDMVDAIKSAETKVCPICNNTGLTNKIPKKDILGRPKDSGKLDLVYKSCWKCSM